MATLVESLLRILQLSKHRAAGAAAVGMMTAGKGVADDAELHSISGILLPRSDDVEFGRFAVISPGPQTITSFFKACHSIFILHPCKVQCLSVMSLFTFAKVEWP